MALTRPANVPSRTPPPPAGIRPCRPSAAMGQRTAASMLEDGSETARLQRTRHADVSKNSESAEGLVRRTGRQVRGRLAPQWQPNALSLPRPTTLAILAPSGLVGFDQTYLPSSTRHKRDLASVVRDSRTQQARSKWPDFIAHSPRRLRQGLPLISLALLKATPRPASSRCPRRPPSRGSPSAATPAPPPRRTLPA